MLFLYILLYILLGVLALAASYMLFLWICGFFVDTKREYEEHSPFYRWLLYGFTTLGLGLLGVRLHLSGLEKLPKDTMVLFVSNHRSNYDPIVTWHLLKRWNIAFISKASNFDIPILGRIIRRCCFMVIDRDNPRNAIRTIQKAAGMLSSGVFSIGVYPEGTRNRGQGFLPFHNGVFKIAQKANAPIAVLTVSGTEKVHKNYFRRVTDVYVDIVRCIPAEEVVQTKTDILGQQILKDMENNLKKRENV